MVEDFRRRFFVSLMVTVPILALSPMIQGGLGVAEAWAFPNSFWDLDCAGVRRSTTSPRIFPTTVD